MMRTVALESLQSKRLNSLASSLANKDDEYTLKVTENFLRSVFVYSSEIVETILTPDYMLSGLQSSGKLVGDCDDISTLHAALLTAMGFNTRFVAIRSTYLDPNFDHVFIEVESQSRWIPYDITIPLGTKIEYFGKLTVAL